MCFSTSSEFPLEKHVSLKSIYRGKITTPDGKNVRKTTFIVISELQAKLLASAEDDVKSLVLIASVSVFHLHFIFSVD